MASSSIKVFRAKPNRKLLKLLRRYSDQVLDVIIIMQLDNQQVGALVRHYKLEPLSIPWKILSNGV
ncbi:MAG: hypothetical protein GSR81_06005 [Desulfurococcales archaeon]|nr:hypothetical protein [Desulfurococcales archaeon]